MEECHENKRGKKANIRKMNPMLRPQLSSDKLGIRDR